MRTLGIIFRCLVTNGGNVADCTVVIVVVRNGTGTSTGILYSSLGVPWNLGNRLLGTRHSHFSRICNLATFLCPAGGSKQPVRKTEKNKK